MDFYFTDVFEKVYYVLMTIGCFLWFRYLYLKESNKKIGLTAHFVIAISMGLRFFVVADSCLFGGEVPAYAILIFGIPSGIALLTEVVLINHRLHREIEIKYKNLLLVMNCAVSGVIAVYSIFFILLPLGELSLEDIMAVLFYTGVAGTFGSIAWKERGR